MTWEWQIGDPVDDSNGGTMDAQNWGHGGDDDDEDDNRAIGNASPDPRIGEYSKKAWDLYMDFKEDEALRYINMALNLDDRHSENWNRKAIILEAMKRYDESERCYDRSLELSKSNLVYDNKARMLYAWASQLLGESKDVPDGREMLEEAKRIIKRAMKALPGESSEEDIDKYLRQWDSINFYIDYEWEHVRNIEKLESHGKGELFTITGIDFHKTHVRLTPEKPLRLVREPENEFDPDAIAVYVEGEKIGYVANSGHTKFEMTSSASELKGKIEDVAAGEYLLYLNRYAQIEFHIGRIVK